MTTTEQATRQQVVRPLGNICEENGQVVLRLEMPGVSKDGVEIRIEDNHLIVWGHRQGADIRGTYLVRERSRGDFYQRFTLDQTVDQTKVDASMNRGVLTVSLSLKDEVKPRKIEVKSE
ncbi:MAG: Hsp20/alpha crystallin family protein [Spirochaetaceae bacterium]